MIGSPTLYTVDESQSGLGGLQNPKEISNIHSWSHSSQPAGGNNTVIQEILKKPVGQKVLVGASAGVCVCASPSLPLRILFL